MVRIDRPPPNRGIAPVLCDIPAGATLVRVFNPSRRGATALTFRFNGPRMRFDHHPRRGPQRDPCDDPDRDVYYASWSEEPFDAFASCLVEVFGDTGIVALEGFQVAMPRCSRPLHLLDVRGHGAMRAGTMVAIAKCERELSQAWSRYFYENDKADTAVDGLLYANAHNDGPAVMLYERSERAPACPASSVIRLDHPSLRPLLLEAMRQNNLTF